MILGALKPLCSRCLKAVPRAVGFVARGVRSDGRPNLNRGAARITRLCRKCLRELTSELKSGRQVSA